MHSAMPYLLSNDAFNERRHWDQVTEENIKELRHRLEQWTERHDECYAEDLQRVMEDDDYCRMIITQMDADMPGAHKYLPPMLRWRRAWRLHDLTEESLPRKVFERGIIYPQGKDKAGCHILVLRNKNFCKGFTEPETMKKVFVFFAEKLYNECGAKKITILIDCTDCGLSNVDVDLIKFMVDLFITKYPIGIGHALIYNMPWLLNAVLKLIKSIMPHGTERLVTVKKDEILNYVDAKYLPERMGGMDTYEYSYVPGNPLGDRAHY